jgi:AcrR family transcriptional regulator
MKLLQTGGKPPAADIRGRTPKGSNTRERILLLARQIIVEEGFDCLALRDLAKRCDMQLGNLQYYFATREELAKAVIEAEALDDVGMVNRARERHTDPHLVLADTIRALISRWQGESAMVFAALNYLCLHKPSFMVLRKRIYGNFYQTLEGVVSDLAPALPPAAVRARVTLVTALIDGAAGQLNGDRRKFVEAVIETAHAIITANATGDARRSFNRHTRIR